MLRVLGGAHGLRYLSKKGHRGALEVLGYDSPKIGVELFLDVSALAIGQVLNLGCHIISSSDRTQSLLIDYIVWHVRANGT